uniref:ULP_PROTEASE domain-containing protein n=1 Tax=Angiostrongylus cantonensis TaxID=6313 RepID=A0A0K0CTL8_ANGCA
MIVDEDDLVKEIAESVSIIRDAGGIFERKNDVFTKVMGKRPMENGESSALKAIEDAVHEEKPSRVYIIKEHSDFMKSALEDEINDDIVVVDECSDGDELDTPTSEEHELSKKRRNYKRKIVRIPKEVFDYMARIEGDGVVRLNITQLFVFLTNELARKSIHVDANTWDSTDKVPILDVSVPPTAKLNPTLIVELFLSNFDNDPVHREAQETRLKSILEHRQSHIHTVLRKPRPQANETAVTKILSVDLQVDKNLAKRQLWRDKKGEERKERNEGKSVNHLHEKTEKGNKEKSLGISELRQKRLAVHDALSAAEESSTVAKQSRLDSSNSTYPKPNTKIFPNRRDELTPHSRAGGIQDRRYRGKTSILSSYTTRSGFVLGGDKDRKQTFYRPYSSSLTASNTSRNATGRQFASVYYQHDGRNRQQRYSSVRYGEINPFNNREESVEVSPWSRPPLISRELHKLEEVMRRAAQNNASSIDAARQVEELGLSSVMGTMLNVANHMDLPVPSRGHSFNYSSSLPVRPTAPMTNNSLSRLDSRILRLVIDLMGREPSLEEIVRALQGEW